MHFAFSLARAIMTAPSPTTHSSPSSFPVRCVATDTYAIPSGSTGTTNAASPASATRILAASFGDVEWVAVSQTGALGTLVRAVPSSAGRGPGGDGGGGAGDNAGGGLPLGMEGGEAEDAGDADPGLPPAPTITTLVGRRDDPAAAALARLLLARLAAVGAGGKPLLLACALNDGSPAAVRAAAAAVVGVWDGR